MSRLIFEEEYVIVVPTFNDVKPHRQDFYHIFFLEQEGGQEIGPVRRFIFRHLGRHLMNRNVRKIRELRKLH